MINEVDKKTADIKFQKLNNKNLRLKKKVRKKKKHERYYLSTKYCQIIQNFVTSRLDVRWSNDYL